MRMLGIDYGERKIGLAVSEGVLVEPLMIVNSKIWAKIIPEICVKNGIEKIVVGLPEGRLESAVRQFADRLKMLTGLMVEFQDETLTSYEAMVKMKERGKVQEEDAFSAALILQSYLDKSGDA